MTSHMTQKGPITLVRVMLAGPPSVIELVCESMFFHPFLFWVNVTSGPVSSNGSIGEVPLQKDKAIICFLQSKATGTSLLGHCGPQVFLCFTPCQRKVTDDLLKKAAGRNVLGEGIFHLALTHPNQPLSSECVFYSDII